MYISTRSVVDTWRYSLPLILVGSIHKDLTDCFVWHYGLKSLEATFMVIWEESRLLLPGCIKDAMHVSMPYPHSGTFYCYWSCYWCATSTVYVYIIYLCLPVGNLRLQWKIPRWCSDFPNVKLSLGISQWQVPSPMWAGEWAWTSWPHTSIRAFGQMWLQLGCSPHTHRHTHTHIYMYIYK